MGLRVLSKLPITDKIKSMEFHDKSYNLKTKQK